MPLEKDKSLDLLGIKGVSDSIKIVTQGMVDGAAALLSRICLPAAEEFGELLREKVSRWRIANAITVLNKADEIIKKREAVEGALKAPAQIVYRTIEIGSWSSDETLTSMWAGLLASSCTAEGDDESNLIFSDLISHFSPAQARLFDWIGNQCPKYHDKLGVVQGDHFNPSVQELLQAGRITDVNQLESELSRLFGFGLFHQAMGATVLGQCKGLSALALNFYMRVHGGRGDPKHYFKTVFKEIESDQNEASSRWA
jgi:hypothetical protein